MKEWAKEAYILYKRLFFGSYQWRCFELPCLNFICEYTETCRLQANRCNFLLKFTKFKSPRGSEWDKLEGHNHYRGSIYFSVQRRKTWRNCNLFIKLDQVFEKVQKHSANLTLLLLPSTCFVCLREWHRPRF